MKKILTNIGYVTAISEMVIGASIVADGLLYPYWFDLLSGVGIIAIGLMHAAIERNRLQRIAQAVSFHEDGLRLYSEATAMREEGMQLRDEALAIARGIVITPRSSDDA